MITIIGAGTGNAESITLSGLNAVKSAGKVFLKTEKMPLAALLKKESIPYSTLDFIFEAAEDFDELNKKTAEFLKVQGDCAYIVHGSGLDDTSVPYFDKTEIEIIPGISVAAQASATIKTASGFSELTATEVLDGEMPNHRRDYIITGIDSQIIASDLKCILTELYGDEYEAQFYCEAFDGSITVTPILLYELDMQRAYNHTASVYLKKCDITLEGVMCDFDDLIAMTRLLASPEGCPWDSVQTHESLRPFLVEEAYEVADTIDKDDCYALSDELGDVLFQVTLHAAIAEKSGEFKMNEITNSIVRKMIGRHPHIYSENDYSAAGWEEIKMKEKSLKTTADVIHDIPEALPALAYAEKVLYKAKIKLPDDESITEAIIADLNKTSSEEALTDILFRVVELCLKNGIRPETALHTKTRKYIDSLKNE